jgi:hypothetical protein
MRTTARYTLFIGFSVASIAAFVVMRFGTDFTTMTAVLYLYGIVAVVGGLIGHRRAYLKHAEDIAEPTLRHLVPLDHLGSLFEDDRWTVRMDEETFEAEKVAVSEKLVSVEREIDGRSVGVSYPRSDILACKKINASR